MKMLAALVLEYNRAHYVIAVEAAIDQLTG